MSEIDWEKSSNSPGIGHPRWIVPDKSLPSNFFKALTTKDLLGENGMPTHSTSGSYVVDFFYKMGGYRGERSPRGEMVGLFAAAFGENPNLAVKALFNLRDVRGGMGERNSGRILLHYLAKSHPDIASKILSYVPVYGRWDDLLYFLGTPIETEMAGFYLQALLRGDKLAAKWCPRENKRGPDIFKKGAVAKFFMKMWGMKPAEYRGLLSHNTQVVESLMCSNQWGKIRFETVPGVALKNYKEAFQRHCEEKWGQYLKAVESGEKKINTSALSPVDILHNYLQTGRYDKALELLWENLPDTVGENLLLFPMVDGSGSMFTSANPSPAEVAFALGLYLAERNKSIFHDGFLTFSREPRFIKLPAGTLWDRMTYARSRTNFAENTNLQKAFELILQAAVQNKLSQEDLPTHILIISDMQFDQCVEMGESKGGRYGGYYGNRFQETALEMIDRKFADAGYTRPGIIFWNVATATGVPVKVTDKGTALVSGYSANLMRNILQNNLSPMAQVLAILNNGRYDFVDEIVK